MPNALYYGDNLAVLRESIASESVDLVYLDPPFNSQATYNLLFRSPAGVGSQAQIEAFEDTWHWSQEAETAFDQVIRSGHTNAADLLRAIRSFLGENDMMAYLAMMAIRLIELHRVLKPTGALYLHCDPTASHYLKIILDGVFGATQFRNEIIWQRSKNPKGSQHQGVRWGPSTDTILFYAKSGSNRLNVDAAKAKASQADIAHRYPKTDENGRWADGPILRSDSMGARTNLVYEYNGFTPGPAGWRMERSELEKVAAAGDLYWTSEGRPRRKVRPDASELNPLSNCWTDISPINSQAQERLGYPTQKPISLLERIVRASSDPGGVVLDPFCGCGTAIHAAQKLGRKWIGIDVTHLAISLIERRLKDAFPGIAFEVHGTPTDLDGARDLALRDKYQFQWWAVSLIDAQPYGGKKKGADGGIDGLIYFRSDPKTTERAIVSVKGGGVSVPMVRDLKGVLDREKAPIGVFLTLEAPTRPMEKEAASAGFYTLGDRQYPRLQIITIEDALRGVKPAIPLIDTGAAFRRAPREGRGDQTKFEL
jgi:site-specific DNA-methyltransferase (adenine-specific)